MPFLIIFLVLITILLASCNKSEKYSLSDCQRFEDYNKTYVDCVLCIKQQTPELVEPCIKNLDDYVLKKEAYLKDLYDSVEKMRFTCSQIEETEKRNLCYYFVAFNKTDIESCKYISDETIGINCVTATYTTLYDTTSCQNLSAQDTDYCYLYAAIAKNESELCKSIKDDKYKIICNEQFY